MHFSLMCQQRLLNVQLWIMEHYIIINIYIIFLSLKKTYSTFVGTSELGDGDRVEKSESIERQIDTSLVLILLIKQCKHDLTIKKITLVHLCSEWICHMLQCYSSLHFDVLLCSKQCCLWLVFQLLGPLQ